MPSTRPIPDDLVADDLGRTPRRPVACSDGLLVGRSGWFGRDPVVQNRHMPDPRCSRSAASRPWRGFEVQQVQAPLMRPTESTCDRDPANRRARSPGDEVGRRFWPTDESSIPCHAQSQSRSESRPFEPAPHSTQEDHRRMSRAVASPGAVRSIRRSSKWPMKTTGTVSASRALSASAMPRRQRLPADPARRFSVGLGRDRRRRCWRHRCRGRTEPAGPGSKPARDRMIG